jgi:hypothetical protein
MKKLLLILVLLPLQDCFAQAPDIGWQKSFGGTGTDAGTCVLQTSDGGFIIAGDAHAAGGDVSENFGADDFWVIKLNGEGTLEWQKSYGGSANEIAFGLDETIDGGYIIAGYTLSADGDVTQSYGEGDVWVIKLDSEGALEWQKSYGGSAYDGATAIEQTTDGGYIVSAVTLSIDGNVTFNNGADDFWIIKLDGEGTIEWQKTYGGSDTDAAYSIRQTTDDGYIVAGHTQSVDGDVSGLHTIEEVVNDGDYWVVKLDSGGNLQWQRALGGFGNDFAFSVCTTSDGGYAVNGISTSNDGDASGNHNSYDYWVVKLDANGSLQWQKMLGGASYDEGKSILQTADGGYIASGSAVSDEGDVTGSHGNSDYWMVKLDAAGTIEWEKAMGGANGDYGYAAIQTADGNYCMAGYTYSDNGEVTLNNGEGDVWVVKLGAATAGIPTMQQNSISLYPNPVTDVLNIIPGNDAITDVAIYNLMGQTVTSESWNAQNQTVNTSALTPGTYIVKVNAGEYGKVLKMIKQ